LFSAGLKLQIVNFGKFSVVAGFSNNTETSKLRYQIARCKHLVSLDLFVGTDFLSSSKTGASQLFTHFEFQVTGLKLLKLSET
jgi:hypothetical protein